MRYGLDQWIATPPFAAFNSLLLLAGCDAIGYIILKWVGCINSSRWNCLRLMCGVVGAMALAILLYPLVIYSFANHAALQIVAIGLMVLGGAHIIQCVTHLPALTSDWIANLKREVVDVSAWCLLGACLFALFILSLSPTTSADALDYHMGIPIAILNHGGMPFAPEWFTGRLAGNGEILNALALTVGAEQFGALLQFASILAICGLMLGGRQADWSVAWRGDAVYVGLACVSVPVLLFLVSASKPQLWPIALTTGAFALLMHSSFQSADQKTLAKRYLLVCFMAAAASQAKFNYLLGGGLAGLLGFLLLVGRRMWVQGALIGLSAVFLIAMPPVIWKAIHYSASWWEALTHPMPGRWPGTDEFIALAQRSTDYASSLPFPLSIFIPTGLGGFTTILGVGWLICWGVVPKFSKYSALGLIASLILLLIVTVLAPPSARPYLEPCYWLMFLCLVSKDSTSVRIWGRVIVMTQATVFLVAACFGAFTLSAGAFAMSWRESVMLKSANGYDVMRWVDQTLPKDAVVLNSHRSMALLPRDGVDASWLKFVDPESTQAIPYLERLKQSGVTHILLLSNPRDAHPLAGCFGSVVGKAGQGRVVSRNPFNQGDVYPVWLLNFDSSRLPACANQPSSNTPNVGEH